MAENGKKMIHEETFYDKKLGPCWVKNNDHKEGSLNHGFAEKISERIFIPGNKNVLLNELISLLDSAQNQICIASFLISDSNIVKSVLNASERGVDVYILTASETKLLSEPTEDNEFEKKTIEEHKNLLDNLVGKALLRTAEHFHTKFILIDPRLPTPKGFLLTSNLTTEALTRNPEIAIRISENEVKDLFYQFCIGFWNESERELLESGKLGNVGDKFRGFVPDYINSEKILCTAKKINTLKNKILELINETDGDILVCSFGFERQNEVVESLINALKKGRKVTVLARPRAHKNSKDTLVDIIKEGGKVYGLEYLHAKCIVSGYSENCRAIVMTANLEEKGMDKGFETGILLSDKSAMDLHSLMVNWVSGSQYYLTENIKQGDLTGVIKLWEGEKLVEKIIEPLYELNLGGFMARKGKSIETAKPSKFPWPMDTTKLYHVHRYIWTALPSVT